MKEKKKGQGERGKRKGSFGFLGFLLVALCLGFGGAGAASAAGPLEVALVSEVTAIQPGKPFYAGLHLKHREGYHTYWKFPGIVGVPVSMKWKLPEGWTPGEIEWPEPEQVHMFKIRAQGYHGELVLPVKLTPPANLAPGTKVKLDGQAAWMCCGRDCNPDFADLTLELPVASSDAPVAMSALKEKFARAKAALPHPLPAGWVASATRKDGRVTLRLTPSTDSAKAVSANIKEVLFFTDDGYINADKDQVFRKEADGSLTLGLEVSQYYDGQGPPKALLGLLQTPGGWGKEFTSKTAVIGVKFAE